MKIIDRFKAESTELGKWLQYKIPIFFAGVEILQRGLSSSDPTTVDIIPIWFRQSLGIFVLLGMVYGSYTVKNKDNDQLPKDTI